jgi:hypothetical protein
MFAWILILGSWLAVLSLILHDATKEDDNGGAIRVAASNVGTAVSWATSWAMLKTSAVLKARASREKTSQPAAQGRASKASPPRGLLGLRKRDWWHKDHRLSMTAEALELAIAEAVRKASPGCEDFVSVIVARRTPKSRLDPDWAVRGVRYGNADRRTVDKALSTVVERMQREIRLSID